MEVSKVGQICFYSLSRLLVYFFRTLHSLYSHQCYYVYMPNNLLAYKTFSLNAGCCAFPQNIHVYYDEWADCVNKYVHKTASVQTKSLLKPLNITFLEQTIGNLLI